MSFPDYISKGVKGSGVGGTVTFDYMAGIEARDLLLLYVVSIGLGGLDADPSWEAVATGIFPNTPVAAWTLYAKLADGTEAGSEDVDRSVSGSLFMAQVYQFRSPFGTPVIESISNLTTGGITDLITWGAVGVNGKERTLAAFVINYDGANPATPALYTNEATDNDGTTFMELNVKENVIAGGAVTATGGSSDGWTTVHLALRTRPAARNFIIN